MDENWETGPSVRRIVERAVTEALTRNGVHATSALANEVRARATMVWPPRCEPAVRVPDDTNRDVTLDAYIQGKRSDPAYASSFIADTAAPRISVTDQQGLFAADLGMVARGEIEIADDRERPLR